MLFQSIPNNFLLDVEMVIAKAIMGKVAVLEIKDWSHRR